jgi:hypothetical protein
MNKKKNTTRELEAFENEVRGKLGLSPISETTASTEDIEEDNSDEITAEKAEQIAAALTQRIKAVSVNNKVEEFEKAVIAEISRPAGSMRF